MIQNKASANYKPRILEPIAVVNKEGISEQNKLKMQNIDPSTQGLFAILPPPSKTKFNEVSLSSALQSNTKINMVPYVSDDEDIATKYEENE